MARGPCIAVVGGDLVGVSLAGWLAELGAEVVLIEAADKLAVEMPPPRRWRALHRLADGNVLVLPNTTLVAIESDAVVCRSDDADRRVRADTVILARGIAPNPALAELLAADGIESVSVGDCTGPRYFEGSLDDAWRAALAI